MIDEIVRRSTSRAGVVRVRNALNPLLWIIAVASPVCLLSAYAFRDDPILRYSLVGLGALPILVSLGAYIYFMFRNPNRLQSEDYLLRQQELEIIDRKSAPSIPLAVDVLPEASDEGSEDVER